MAGANLNVGRLHVAVVVALHFAVADVDLGAHGDVEHPVLEDFLLGVHAVGGHGQTLAAELLLELRVVETVVTLDLLDGAIDLVARHRELELGRLLGQQLILDQALQHLAADAVGAGLALGRIGHRGELG